MNTVFKENGQNQEDNIYDLYTYHSRKGKKRCMEFSQIVQTCKTLKIIICYSFLRHLIIYIQIIWHKCILVFSIIELTWWNINFIYLYSLEWPQILAWRSPIDVRILVILKIYPKISECPLALFPQFFLCLSWMWEIEIETPPYPTSKSLINLD